MNFQLGDRVIRLNGQHAVVADVREAEVLCHWGTTQVREGQETVERRFEDWVPMNELVFCDEPVYFGDGDKKQAIWTGKL